MTKVILDDSSLDAIGDSIRAKNGTSVKYKPSEMSAAIDAIPQGTDTSDATLNSNSQMLNGVTSYSKGVKYTGSIPSRTSSDLTASGATVTVPAGHYASQATKSVSSGSASAPSTISGTSATVSTGTNTLTLSKTVSVTPSVTAGYISSGTATNSSVSLQASVTTKGPATITPTTTDQTISSGTYITGTQTIKGDSNLVAGNIKSGVSIFNIQGTYEGDGGGLKVKTATATPVSASSSISFSVDAEPTSFVICSSADLSTGASPYKTASVVFDGSNIFGQYITNSSNANVTYDGSGFSKSYNNGTLTVTGTGTNFQANEYTLVYTYGGSADTQDVQVGSGATSIAFTDLEDEPSYFSCVFKSNFGTSSGYQRVISVVYDGTDTYGLAMDSGAKAQTSWSYTYNNGTLTITSQGTNNGGYFHQPGYYQLTYGTATGGGNYQSKTVTPSASDQVITADVGYDALKKVTVEGDADLIASNIKSGVSIFNVLGTYSGGGSGKNVQAYLGYDSRTANSYGSTSVTLTVAKAGTYKVSWTAWRGSSSGTMGTNLYKNSTAGTNQQTWTGTYGQCITLNNQTYAQGDVLTLYATSGSNSRTVYVGNLIIEEQ